MATRQNAFHRPRNAPPGVHGQAMRAGIAAMIMAVVSLSGCALQPIHPEQIDARVDPISIPSAGQYHADLDECARFANASLERARNTAVTQAVVGGLIGALIGQAIGGGRRWADTPALRNTGAAYGALVGGSQAVTHGANRADTIVLNCLVHRGYALLY